MFRSYFLLFYFIIVSPLFAIDIDTTIENTIKNNQKIKIGLEKLVESKEMIEKATGALLPTITTTFSGTYEQSEKQDSTSTTSPETFTDKYKLSITQNLYDAGYNKLEVERSKILFDNEIINFKITLQNLILDAINGYLTVINYEQSLEATSKNFEFVSKALDEVKTKFSIGSSTIYELQNAESAFAIAEANLYAAEENLNISKISFKRIAGIPAINLEDQINIDQSININSVFENALINNLNLILINNDIKNKEILLLKEKKSKHLSIDFTGSAEYSDSGRIDSGTETTKGTLGLTLTLPLYQQGIDNSNIRKYQSQILQSEMNFEDYKDDLNIQISNTLKDLKISEANMKSNSARIKASETSISILKEENKLGTKTIADLIEEEGNLLLSQVDYLNSKKDYLINYFEIKLLEGSLLDNFDKYLPSLN